MKPEVPSVLQRISEIFLQQDNVMYVGKRWTKDCRTSRNSDSLLNTTSPKTTSFGIDGDWRVLAQRCDTAWGVSFSDFTVLCISWLWRFNLRGILQRRISASTPWYAKILLCRIPERLNRQSFLFQFAYQHSSYMLIGNMLSSQMRFSTIWTIMMDV